MSAYEAARKAAGFDGLTEPKQAATMSPAISQGFQVVNGLHDAASNHSAEALKMASDASTAMEAANTAHINGADHAAVVRHLAIVDEHINNLGRKLGGSNDASNLDPAVTYAQSPSGSALADTYAKECNY